ncbi:hypothetical protein N0V90_008972 [Kalmusia sp. IMI 367209]|nr:hypothetical protein N0V90_008972 [Kalmusia sp. IMI 367209]
MTEINKILALAEGVKNTGSEIISIGKKLHMLADALTTEANAVAEEHIKLENELAAVIAAAERNKNAGFDVDVLGAAPVVVEM